MTSVALSERGTRNYNEDSFYKFEDSQKFLYVVADGLGGHGKGEVASKFVVDTFKYKIETCNMVTPNFLSDCILTAQSCIMQEQKRLNVPSQMKTTCVALLVNDNMCNIAFIGDSRAYVFNKNKVLTRTKDHSVPQMLVMCKEIKEKDIRKHPDRNRLLKVVGIDWDYPQFELLEPINMSQCQAFLLCSDGFWEFCTEKKMCKFLKKSTSVEQWLYMMHQEVLANGKGVDMDNLTAIAVFC